MTRTAELDEDALTQRLGRQRLVISRDQATACGMTPRALRHRIRAGGPWQRLLPGVYLAATGTPTLIQNEIAALLYVYTSARAASSPGWPPWGVTACGCPRAAARRC